MIRSRTVGLQSSVPDTFRVDNGNRSAFADAKAVCLRPQDPALFRQLQFLEAPLQVVPRRKAVLPVTAFRVGLIATQKNMTPRHRDPDGGRDFAL